MAEPGRHRDRFGAEEDAAEAAAIRLARERGCLTLAFAPAGAEWGVRAARPGCPGAAGAGRAFYHVLWELVHVFFEHRGLLEGRSARRTHDTGASSFLYPFPRRAGTRLDAVMDDVRRSVLAKAEEVGELRAQTLTDNHDELVRRCDASAQPRWEGLLALGNGGSATDAMDVVADFRRPPDPRWRARRARPHRGPGEPDRDRERHRHRGDLRPPGDRARPRGRLPAGDLHERQLGERDRGARGGLLQAARHDRAGRLRRRAGGRGAAGRPRGDHSRRSEHIPRIQEAQASAYHVLRELVG